MAGTYPIGTYCLHNLFRMNNPSFGLPNLAFLHTRALVLRIGRRVRPELRRQLSVTIPFSCSILLIVLSANASNKKKRVERTNSKSTKKLNFLRLPYHSNYLHEWICHSRCSSRPTASNGQRPNQRSTIKITPPALPIRDEPPARVPIMTTGKRGYSR
jgi:hypothetical protein